MADGVEEQCKTFYETACTTKYVEKQPGKFVGDTNCEKLPVELCGAGCSVEEGDEECHDKEIDTLVDVPEEVSNHFQEHFLLTRTIINRGYYFFSLFCDVGFSLMFGGIPLKLRGY